MNRSRIIILGLTFLIICAAALLLVRWHGYVLGEDEVIRTTYAFLDDCERKEFEQAAALLDSEFSTKSADGTELMDKGMYVSSLKKQLHDVSSIRSRACSVSFASGGNANVSCYVEISWESNDDTPIEHFGNYDFELKKRENRWKIFSMRLRR